MLTAVSLFVVSALTGVAMLWMFSKLSNQRAIKATKKRLQARLLEMRLYADDPRVIIKAQKALLAENLKYFLLMLRPAFVVTLPMILMLVVMDGFYGRRAFHPGESAMVTARLSNLTESTEAVITVPDGVTVETAGVRVLASREVSWRIRPDGELKGPIRVAVDGEEAEKQFAAGDSALYLVNRRVASAPSWFLYPGELLIGEDGFEWIEVRYPSAAVSYFGLKAHWLVWFMLYSMVIAFLLKDRFGVTV
jgi:uncharacterized membrane protein (DUF106 family)